MADELTGRRLRRQVARQTRPAGDLRVAHLPNTPYVLVGLTGAGYVRLSPVEARQLIAELERLAGDADGHGPGHELAELAARSESWHPSQGPPPV